jgi:hypothetical protein
MKRLSIVYQTHWDREWYFTVDTYLVRMKRVIDRILGLLDRDEIAYFVFDGQVRALEDYLSVCEDDERRTILDYVKEGRIIIGPWYVLADEFLVSGESLIRNLEIGRKKAEVWGTPQSVGYLPDTFGHISQMPQILRMFDIDNAVLWRGVVPEEVFFDWEAPNQDKVFTLYLKEGYYQPVIEQEQYLELFRRFVEKMDAFSYHPHHILTNGGDHLMPAEADIQARIQELEETFDVSIDITTYEAYLNDNKEVPRSTIQGELRDNHGIYVLPNVLSSRSYLKVQNRRTEHDLKTLEALIAMAHPFEPYANQRIVDSMWETLLLNHPHDSICGCSIDDVHTEMETRSMKLGHSHRSLVKELCSELGAYSLSKNYDDHATRIFDDYQRFALINPTARRIHEWRVVRVFLSEASPLLDRFVVQRHGTRFTTVILAKTAGRTFESPLEDAPQFRKGFWYDIAFRVTDLAGLAASNYELVEGDCLWMESVNETFIENQWRKIEATEDGLTITNKTDGTVHRHQHRFVSSLDAGDEYNYSQPKQDHTSIARLTNVEVRRSPGVEEMVLTYELVLPAGLNEAFDGPSSETVVDTITSRLRLFTDRTDLEVETTIDNRAKNQRLRLLFDTNGPITTHWSDTAFDLVERKVREEVFEAPRQKEVPVVVDPSLSCVLLDNGMRFDHLGLHEYQVLREDTTDQLAVTLIRSVGHLSRDDLRSRGGGAGPSFATPDAQMIGTYTFTYRFDVASSFDAATNETFLQDLIVTKGHIDSTASLFELVEDQVGISAIRTVGQELEVRLYNPTDTARPLTWYTSYPVESIQNVNALGQPIERDASIIGAKEIRTMRLRLTPIPTEHTEVLVVGASLGGVQAAVSLLEAGRSVVLTEATAWIGGQLTSQAVPLDEHRYIEEFGCTTRYRAFRDAVRTHYATNENLKPGIDSSRLNPGNAWVTRLAFEPAVAHDLLMSQLEPHLERSLTLMTKTRAIAAQVQENRVVQVTLENVQTRRQTTVTFDHVLDGTDQGDLLPLCGVEYTTGRESKDQTGEHHATSTADSADRQPVTHVVAMEWVEGATKPIEKPSMYEYFASYQTPYSDKLILSPYGPDSSTGTARRFDTYEGRYALWRYRRFYDPTLYDPAKHRERTTINWPQNDYFMGNLFDDEYEDVHRQMAKELTRSFVYYLQTGMPREDGGTGYPEMQIATDALGTEDGFAMTPYVRESRRIVAMKTVREEDVSAHTNESLPHVEDSIGVGSYHIDLHITTRSHRFFFDNTWPFEIPLGAMIPIRIQNLLPACKNIGTTHLTNGCFRLHPVEWNVGEVAGYLSDFLLRHDLTPQAMYANKALVETFQRELDAHGVERSWPDDVEVV